MTDSNGSGRLLTPGETAERFGVSVKTVTRWAKKGKLPHSFTLGGHRRFREDLVDAMVRGEPAQQSS